MFRYRDLSQSPIEMAGGLRIYCIYMSAHNRAGVLICKRNEINRMNSLSCASPSAADHDGFRNTAEILDQKCFS